jgi:fructose-bisphosphate aldolase class II
MKSLQEYIADAVSSKIAIGHFNISTLDGIWAVADAAESLKVPVIVGVSEGERDYVGVRQAAAIIKSIREQRNQPIFLNADHTYSFERVKEAILAGFDEVIFDGAKLSLEENIKITKQCVEFAREHTAKIARIGGGTLIEGELGYIGSSSKMLDAIPEGAVIGDAAMTSPEDAARFVKETGVDLLAPAIGNIHGVIRGGDPALNFERARQIRESIGVPLVLHGASGNTASDIEKTIQSGVAIVHINTELRLAYRSGLVKSLSDDREELSPYKYLKPAKLAMQKVIEEKIKIFSGMK